MRRAAWLSFSVVALLLLVLTLDRVAERGRFATAYSSYGSGPRGTRALYLLIEELLGPPVRWAQDLARLPPAAVLVALGGCDVAMARPVSRYERQELVRWVRAGGVLVVAGARDYLPQAFGVGFRFDSRCKTAWTELLDRELAGGESEREPGLEGRAPAADGGVESDASDFECVPDGGVERPNASDAGAVLAADGGGEWPEADAAALPGARAPGDLGPSDTIWAVPVAPALRGLAVIPFRDAGELALVPDLDPEILLGDPRPDASGRGSDFAPLGVVLQHGLGRVIVLASASMLQNAELAESDGGELFIRLLRRYAPGAPVLFDEYHLGIGERRSLMRYLRQMGAIPLALQLAFVIALVLWRRSARFGAIQPPPPPPPPATASFVQALGQLYARSADARGALELIARDAYARIASYHHLEAGSPAKLIDALQARGAQQAAQAVRDIEAAARSGETAGPALLAGVAAIDAALARATSGG